MPFFAASEAPPRPESMKFPVNSLLAGNLAFFRDEFAADSPLQERVHCERDQLLQSASLETGRPKKFDGVPMVRIHLPPAESLRTIGPLALAADWVMLRPGRLRATAKSVSQTSSPC